MKIGLVDLDTSHPQNWIPILRTMGHEIAGVLDNGDVHPAGYAAQFASQHQIPRVYASLEEMAADVDCAIIHGCDWGTHIAKARPFVEAHKSVLVDKPLAGNKSDLQQLVEWARNGARISGGSSLRFGAETNKWLQQPVDERGTPQTVFCGCGVDEFNYGIHAYSMLLAIMGNGVESVQHIGGAQRQLQFRWSDGRSSILSVGESAGWLPFYATIVTEKTVAHVEADTALLYQALLDATMPYLSGATDVAPLTPEDWILPELCALAAKQSWENGDCEVALSEVSSETSYNGPEFATIYRRQKYPNG